MTTPRQLVAVLAFCFVVIGVQTLRYPPEFLAWSPLWSSVAIFAGLACTAATVHPRRIYVALSGATAVTAAGARGFALIIEWAHQDSAVEAGYIVGAVSWWMIGLLIFVTWREYVLPWAIGRPPG